MAPEEAPPGLRLGAAPPPGLKEVNSWLLLRCMGLTGLSIMLSCLEGIRLHCITPHSDHSKCTLLFVHSGCTRLAVQGKLWQVAIAEC